jgi:hypothetical protein
MVCCWSGGLWQGADLVPGGDDVSGPGPGGGDVEAVPAAAAGQPGCGVQDAQGLRRGAGEGGVQGEELEPGQQCRGGQCGSLPGLVDGQRTGRVLADAAVFPVVGSRKQIADILALAARASAKSRARWTSAVIQVVVSSRNETAPTSMVIATLTWVLGERAEGPITGASCGGLTTSKLKRERIRADALIEQARFHQVTDLWYSPCYSEGVKTSITLAAWRTNLAAYRLGKWRYGTKQTFGPRREGAQDRM